MIRVKDNYLLIINSKESHLLLLLGVLPGEAKVTESSINSKINSKININTYQNIKIDIIPQNLS